MKKNILSICLVLISYLSVLGQKTAPLKLPTGSAEELRAYALESITRLEAGVSSQSYAQGRGDTYLTRRVSSATEVKRELLKAYFNLNVVNPKDGVYLWVGVSDAEGTTIIRGSSYKALVDAKGGGYTLENSNIFLQYSRDLPIKVDGLRHAVVTQYNEDGTTGNSMSLEVNSEGKFLFPSDLAGKSTIRLYIGDDYEEYIYNAAGQREYPEGVYVSSVGVQIEDTLIVQDNHINSLVVHSNQGYGNNVVIELTLTTDQTVQFFAQTSEGAYPIGFTIRGTTQDSYLIPKGFSSAMNMAEGKYLIWFNWEEVDLRPFPTPTHPPGDMGKGGVTL